MAANVALNNNFQKPIGDTDTIAWQYFFGGQTTNSGGKAIHTRYYFAMVNGVRVEKCWSSPNKRSYSVGNMDHAKKKYKTEEELMQAVNANQHSHEQQQSDIHS